jgi:hypothetical protein
VAGELDHDRQRAFLESKLTEIAQRQRALGEMAGYLRSKLRDLDAATTTAERAG